MDCASGFTSRAFRTVWRVSLSVLEKKTRRRRKTESRSFPQKRARSRFSFDKKVDVIGPGAEISAAHVLVTAVVCLTAIWATVVCESAALAHTRTRGPHCPAYKQRYYGNTVHTYHFTHTFCYFLSVGDGLLIALSWKTLLRRSVYWNCFWLSTTNMLIYLLVNLHRKVELFIWPIW